jgi:hypothetical protein
MREKERRQTRLREKVRFSINWFGHYINSDAFAPPVFFQERILPQKALFQFPVMVGHPHTHTDAHSSFVCFLYLYTDERNEIKTKPRLPLNKNFVYSSQAFGIFVL